MSTEPQLSSPPASVLTIVEQIYHRSVDDEPISFDNRFSRVLETDETVYTRRLKLNTQWTAIDLGYIDNPSLILIVNREGIFPTVKPTQSELDNANRRMINVKYIDSECGFLVPAKESLRLVPTDASQLVLCSLWGTARCLIHVFPG